MRIVGIIVASQSGNDDGRKSNGQSKVHAENVLRDTRQNLHEKKTFEIVICPLETSKGEKVAMSQSHLWENRAKAARLVRFHPAENLYVSPIRGRN